MTQEGRGGREAARAPRFVIHCHETSEGVHWDLMLEAGDVLRTWRLEAPPEAWGRRPVRAVRIFDHRPDFLTWEGRLTGHRGTVRIVDRGTYRRLEDGERLLRLELAGERLVGRLSMRRVGPAGESWTLEPEISP